MKLSLRKPISLLVPFLTLASGFAQDTGGHAGNGSRATFAENAEIEGIRIGMTYEEALSKVKRASYTVKKTIRAGLTASSEIAKQIAAMRGVNPPQSANEVLVANLYAEKSDSPGSVQELVVGFTEDVTRQPAVSVVAGVGLLFTFSGSTDRGLAEKQLRQAVLDKYGTPHSAIGGATGTLNYSDQSTGNSLHFSGRGLELDNHPVIKKIQSARAKKIEDAVNAAKTMPPKPKF